MPSQKDVVDFNIADRYLNFDVEGATHDREHQKRFAAKSVAPMYAVAAPRVMDKPPAKDVFLPRYAVMGMQTKYGKGYKWRPQYQREGTCVGQSYGPHGCSIVMAINALVSGTRFPGIASAGAVYAGSRVEVGRRPGTWQGSVGSWASEWITEYGVVTMEELGLKDHAASDKEWLALIAKDEALGIQWTRSRDGVPATLEKAAKVRPVTSSPLVTTVEEVRAAITNLTPVNLCGQVHPSRDVDSRGVSKRLSRGGGHSTIIVGTYFDERSGKWWYDHMQSWWYYYQGGFCRETSGINGMFAGCITRIPEEWLKRWLVERDCYAIVGVQGLEPIDPGIL